ncbi:hypothetical protein [Halogeometricum borinquense]|uniref:hypothetical protein n=1 Tax=Halogeometricum borinquense TaxID=60847 RepID=UPI0034135C4E
MTTVRGKPITIITNGVAHYFEPGCDEPTRYQGRMELYDSYLRLCDPISVWIPRENVNMVSES